MKKYKIGDLVGSNNSLIIIDCQRIDGHRGLTYKVQCQICKNDHELHGDATYLVDTQYFKSNKLPCGCSKSTRYSEDQLRIILKRKTKLNNYEFVDFVGGKYVDQDTKLMLKCNTCHHSWSSCSLTNYLRDRSCPVCAVSIRATKTATSDEVWISRFRDTGFFPEDKYSFTRKSLTGRLWKVCCKVCGDQPFVSDRSNLVAGKIPCNCGSGGGFDIDKTGYFYVLKVMIGKEISLKYGITGFYKRRIVDHKRTLKTLKGVIVEQMVFMGDGKKVLALESELKRKVPSDNKFIEGFRRESCSIDFYSFLLQSVHDAGLEKLVH